MLGISHRAYFAAVGLFAAWVGFWGYAAPAQVARALPWTVPPMHARFIASMYLAGMLAMFLSLVARQAAAVRIPLISCTRCGAHGLHIGARARNTPIAATRHCSRSRPCVRCLAWRCS